ncbi:SPOR domain-containing protein [Qipengyuania sp. 1NDW9]|uniref:tetratricopeptide repeat protein n=1 Tax=Qipengyuania xiapuensis TaxID=2867236 RepID=UPI001C88213C|nr:SPOR domain-containing protein [Qipengyuania xiapuensis]MBX7492217.1 SPOR domain-containing protein [Qipengyuania xiapuensis]
MTNRNTLIRLAVTTALASTALAGCTGKVAPTAAHSAAKAETALQKGKASKAVDHAEAAVLATPRDAYARTLLGNAYMEAGRFASASQAFSDAIELGDTSPRTVVSLSLAQTGMGDRAAAIYTLERHEAALDAADFGLAIALAGQPQRGVHVLSNALRDGQNTAKVRQNLAYAYAMSGQWREARIMVAEDVPADKVGERMAEWGAIARPEQYRTRVASLLNVEISNDPGLPTMLALHNNPSVDMLASENVEQADSDFAFVAELPAADPAAEEEIVAFDVDAADEVVVAAAAPAAPVRDEPRFAPVDADRSKPVVVASLDGEDEVSAPAAKPAVAAKPAPAAKPAAASKPAAAPTLAVSKGDYNIQLGSYFTMEDALAGWEKFKAMYPELADAERSISKARVNGRLYFRVAAVGYAKDSARDMCSSVKGKGGGCIAYAQNNPLPGALLDNGTVRVAAR